MIEQEELNEIIKTLNKFKETHTIITCVSYNPYTNTESGGYEQIKEEENVKYNEINKTVNKLKKGILIGYAEYIILYSFLLGSCNRSLTIEYSEKELLECYNNTFKEEIKKQEIKQKIKGF
jgi:hypothetical protein